MYLSIIFQVQTVAITNFRQFTWQKHNLGEDVQRQLKMKHPKHYAQNRLRRLKAENSVLIDKDDQFRWQNQDSTCRVEQSHRTTSGRWVNSNKRTGIVPPAGFRAVQNLYPSLQSLYEQKCLWQRYLKSPSRWYTRVFTSEIFQPRIKVLKEMFPRSTPKDLDLYLSLG